MQTKQYKASKERKDKIEAGCEQWLWQGGQGYRHNGMQEAMGSACGTAAVMPWEGHGRRAVGLQGSRASKWRGRKAGQVQEALRP